MNACVPPIPLSDGVDTKKGSSVTRKGGSMGLDSGLHHSARIQDQCCQGRKITLFATVTAVTTLDGVGSCCLYTGWSKLRDNNQHFPGWVQGRLG